MPDTTTSAQSPNADVLVERQLRRERELASLYATARSLTVLQEVDDVLTAIVRNAHELVATDVTYLSVVDDETGELVLRAAEGSVSAEFRQARVSIAVGVAGHVIAKRAPFWVSNYRASTEIEHDPAFDTTLGAEGLVALLGVPLIAGERVLGVLYGANRAARPFPPEEVALLGAFADHAAVALENARLYDQQNRALRDLGSAYSTIEDQVEVMERSARVHESLTRLVLSGAEAQGVAALLSHMMRGDVMILDRDDRILVWQSVDGRSGSPTRTGLGDDAGGPTAEIAQAVAESRQTARCVTVYTAAAGLRCDVAAVVAGTSYLGALVLSQSEDLHDADVRTVERAAQIVGLLTLQQDAVAEAEERVRGELLAEILTSAQPRSPQQRARARARGLDLDAINVLVAFSGPAEHSLTTSRVLRRLAREHGGLAGEHLGVQTLLLHADSARSAVHAAHSSLRAAIAEPIIACATPIDPETEPVGRAFALASRCCRLLVSLGSTDRAATSAELALYATVFDPDRRDELEQFLQDALGPLRDYDAKGRSDLLGTLAAYFAHGGNLTRSARALHVHMNTLLKRLDRISSLIGQQWQQPDEALRLHLAIRLRQLSGDVDPTV